MKGEMHIARGLELAAQGDLREAAAVLRQATEEDPFAVEAFNCLGIVQYKARLFLEAESSLRRAVKLKPDNDENKLISPLEANADFAETAGLITQLDLIITVDSAVAHLAGAMGKKTWLLLPFAPDWRWQIEREDSPWYHAIVPSTKAWRLVRGGDEGKDGVNIGNRRNATDLGIRLRELKQFAYL